MQIVSAARFIFDCTISVECFHSFSDGQSLHVILQAVKKAIRTFQSTPLNSQTLAFAIGMSDGAIELRGWQ